MTVKNALLVGIIVTASASCAQKKAEPALVGTWELISATTTEKDTSFSTFDASHKMIKIINDTHFAFLNHSLKKDTAKADYSAGGGTYTLVDSAYTENLDYFSDPQWENNKFNFVVRINNDTLIQKGVEKVEKLGIDRVIVEKYIRVKK